MRSGTGGGGTFEDFRLLEGGVLVVGGWIGVGACVCCGRFSGTWLVAAGCLPLFRSASRSFCLSSSKHGQLSFDALGTYVDASFGK
jgi:hypothetical protein